MSEHAHHELVRLAGSAVCGVGDGAEDDRDEDADVEDGRVHDHAGGDEEEADEENEGEAQQPTRRTPSTRPTAAEMRAHRVSHLPFRDWCPECIAGRAKDWPHRAQKEVEELAVPEICVDYCFIREEAGDDYSVVLVGKDRGTKLILAHVVPFKGGTLSGLVNKCAGTSRSSAFVVTSCSGQTKSQLWWTCSTRFVACGQAAGHVRHIQRWATRRATVWQRGLYSQLKR